MTERQKIEIDYCPKCRGVWLDRGELDKLIEGASSAPTLERYGKSAAADDDYKKDNYFKRKKSFLSEIFD